MAVHCALVAAVLVRAVAAMKVFSPTESPTPSPTPNSSDPTASPTAAPTPYPTHSEDLPGVACPCLPPTCFQSYDLNNDSLICQDECDLQVPLLGNCTGEATYGPPVWDTDFDGCVNISEWVDVYRGTNGSVCPLHEVEIPDECAQGHYLVWNPTECERCWNGFTRRRRSIECTPCPRGYIDVGDMDDCSDTNTRTIQDAVPNGSSNISVVEPPPPNHCDDIVVGDAITLRGQDPDCLTDDCTLIHQCNVQLIAPILGHGGDVMYVCDVPLPFSMPAYSEIIHTCTTTDGTEISHKYSTVTGGCVCACGDTLCTSTEVCTEYSNGTGVCDRPGPYPDWANLLPTPAPTVGAKGDPHLVNLQGEHFDINHEGSFTLLRFPQAAEKPTEFSVEATIQPDSGRPCTTYITQVELSGAWFGNASVGIRSYRRSHSFAPDVFLGVRLREGEGDSPWQPLEEFRSDDLVLSRPGSDVEVTLSKSAWFPKKRTDMGPSAAGMFTLTLRSSHSSQGAQITIRQDLPEQEHLNVAMRQLSRLGRVDVGGLLGFDPHPDTLERPSAACIHHRATARYRVESQEEPGYHFRPMWQDRWDKIKRERGGGTDVDNEAGASLVSRSASASDRRGAMCKCPNEGGNHIEGVVVEEASLLHAEANWD